MSEAGMIIIKELEEAKEELESMTLEEINDKILLGLRGWGIKG